MTDDQAIKATGGKKKHYVEVILIACISILILIIAGVFISGSIAAKEEKAFKEKAQDFIKASEKLETMTEQGVNIGDFRNQLAEVKSSYNLIGEWPRKYSKANDEFNQAIKGWSFTLEVWNAQIQHPAFVENYVNVDDISEYTGIEKDTLSTKLSGDGMVEPLMAISSDHYMNAKSAVGYQLEYNE